MEMTEEKLGAEKLGLVHVRLKESLIAQIRAVALRDRRGVSWILREHLEATFPVRRQRRKLDARRT